MCDDRRVCRLALANLTSGATRPMLFHDPRRLAHFLPSDTTIFSSIVCAFCFRGRYIGRRYCRMILPGEWGAEMLSRVYRPFWFAVVVVVGVNWLADAQDASSASNAR